MIYKIGATFSLLCCSLFVFAQHTLPPKGELFADDVLPAIYITLPADSLAEILDYDNRYSDYHFHASFVFDNGRVRDSVSNVGFRLRGNTSRDASKKSFKISFNEYVSGQKYQGVEKLNINGEHNDPSMSRAKYCFDFLDYLEVPASRTNHVKLYINGDYFGLYLNVEHYDEEFTQSRFGGQGNLYKCLYGADLKYIGASANNYKLEYYEIKNPEGPGAYEDLAQLIDVLNNASSSDFECDLEHIFNVNGFLKSLVMDVLTGNWDGPHYNKNNFYLYFNAQAGQFEYIPFDLDNTLGVDFLGREWSDRNIYEWSRANSTRPLYTKIMERETYRNRFTFFLDKALREYCNPATVSARLNVIRALISDAALADTIRTLDYGYTFSNFNSSFGYFSKDHVKYGIQDFVTRRYNAALAQAQTLQTVGGIPLWHSAAISGAGDSITYTIRTTGDERIQNIVLQYTWDSQSALWADTLLLVDTSASIFSKTIAWHPTLSQVSFAYLISTQSTRIDFPECNMFSIEKPKNDIKLYINELMADNATTKVDEEGKYEDWIEIYYAGDKAINLEDYYLTDNLANPFKYRLSSSFIVPGGFKLIWADDDAGADHANFKLAKSGEMVALFDKSGALIDSISFASQDADVSLGREQDGAGTWIPFVASTPGYSNTGTAGLEEQESELILYPNPSNSSITLQHAIPIDHIELIDIKGATLDIVWSGQSADISHLPSGIYILMAKIGEKYVHTKVVKTN